MITFIVLGFVICTILFFYFIKVENFWENLGFSYILGGIVYVIIGGIAFACITLSMPTHWEFGWENKIVALQDNKAYIVSRHNVESSDRYYYMVDYGNGHYKQHWVNQTHSDIYETNDGQNVIKTYVEVMNTGNWFLKDLSKFRKTVLNEKHRWEFYVPKGSVVQDFTVDLK